MGLLDMFGTSMDDPRTAATLQLAQGLLSSPRVMQGLAGGLSGYQQAMAQAKQAKAVEEMRQMQLQQMQMQMAAQRQQQEQADLDRKLTQQAFTAVRPIEANAASGIAGPRPEALGVVGKLPAFDPAAFIASRGSPELAFSLQKALTKQGPEYSPTVQYDQEGRAFLVAKDGSHKYIDGVKARDKLITEDLGGAKVLRTEYSPEVRGQYGKTYTPDALLGAATTRRGQDLKFKTDNDANDINKQAQRTQVVVDPARGVFLVDKGNGLATPARTLDGQVVPGADQVAAAKRSSQLRTTLNEAINLLNQGPTSSYIGAGMDKALQAVGISTKSGDLATQLDALSGWAVSNVPRMEGPQSNVDVQNYNIMAGRIGDRTLPISARIAAAKGVLEMTDRYAHLNGGGISSAPSVPSGGAPVLRWNPKTMSFD